MPYSLINGLMFNTTWFAIVLTESAIFAPILALLHLAIHFWVMGRGLVEAKLVLQVTMFGLLLDQLLFWAGVFTVNGYSTLPPLWMTCIWPVLATTFMHAFSGLQRRHLLAALFGAVGGVASFTAGTRLTAVAFGSDYFGPVIMAIIWAIIFPFLLEIARRNSRSAEHYHDW